MMARIAALAYSRGAARTSRRQPIEECGMLGKQLGSLIVLFTLLASACAPTQPPAKRTEAPRPARPAAAPAASPSRAASPAPGGPAPAAPAAAAPGAKPSGKLSVYSALNE